MPKAYRAGFYREEYRGKTRFHAKRRYWLLPPQRDKDERSYAACPQDPAKGLQGIRGASEASGGAVAARASSPWPYVNVGL